MSSDRIRIFALLAALMASPAARADLLDEEEPVAKPEPQPAKPEVKPKPGTPSEKPGKTEPKPEETIKSPSPHPKGNVTGPSTSVIPPKNAKNSKAKGKGEKEPVHFESKGLKGLREKGMVELMQDVVVTQGEMKLEADHAQVFFDEANHEVQKVVAEGNVKVNGVDENSGEKFKAFANRALFLNKDRVVVLEGNARLLRGSSGEIRSKKITYEMDTGWIKADRVSGELAPEEKK